MYAVKKLKERKKAMAQLILSECVCVCVCPLWYVSSVAEKKEVEILQNNIKPTHFYSV